MDKIIDKIAKLLAKAEHPNTTEVERDTFLAKADELMLANAIQEAEVRTSQSPEERRKPVVVEVSLYDAGSVYGQKMRLIAGRVASTLGVRLAYSYITNSATLVGFSEDVAWTQMLFQTIQAAFLGKMRPTWNKELPLSANIAAFRESGLSWGDLSRVAYKNGAIEDYDSKGQFERGDKLMALYKKHCKEQGVEPVTVTRHEAYRHTYAESFTARIMARLEEMADARKSGSVGHELVLFNSKEAVDDAFFQQFPNLSPEGQKAQMERLREEQRLADEKHIAWLASLTPAKRLAHERKVADEREKAQRESDRYWRKADKQSNDRWDGSGAKAGRSAAESINLSTSASTKAGSTGVIG